MLLNDKEGISLSYRKPLIQTKQDTSSLTYFQRYDYPAQIIKTDNSESPPSSKNKDRTLKNIDIPYQIKKNTLLDSLSINNKQDVKVVNRGDKIITRNRDSLNNSHEDNIIETHHMSQQLEELSQLYFKKQEEVNILTIKNNQSIKSLEQYKNQNSKLKFDYEILKRDFKSAVEQIQNDNTTKLSKIQINIDILHDLQIKRLKETMNLLNTEYVKLTSDYKMLLQQKTPRKFSLDYDELKSQNHELREKLKRAEIYIDELQSRDQNTQFSQIPQTSEFNIDTTYPLFLESDMVSRRSFKPPSQKPANKSPSVNSLSSALSFDKRQVMDNFKKMTSATTGMMSNYMDYSSLNKAAIQAEQTLKNARIDLSELIVKRQIDQPGN